jgi:hypothetical protein
MYFHPPKNTMVFFEEEVFGPEDANNIGVEFVTQLNRTEHQPFGIEVGWHPLMEFAHTRDHLLTASGGSGFEPG